MLEYTIGCALQLFIFVILPFIVIGITDYLKPKKKKKTRYEKYQRMFEYASKYDS